MYIIFYIIYCKNKHFHIINIQIFGVIQDVVLKYISWTSIMLKMGYITNQALTTECITTGKGQGRYFLTFSGDFCLFTDVLLSFPRFYTLTLVPT